MPDNDPPIPSVLPALSPAATRAAFVVRLWRETPQSRVWRVQVQNVRTGEVVYLRDPGELSRYFQDLTEQANAAPGGTLK